MRKCNRCGWEWDPEAVQPVIEGWPADMPIPPPLPEIMDPHSKTCPSPVSMGEDVYWDLGSNVGHVGPVRATFVEIVDFEGPEFALQDGTWITATEVVARASIRIIKESVHPMILEFFPDLLDHDHQICFLEDITSASKWPEIIPKESA